MKTMAAGVLAVTVLTSPTWTGTASAAPSPTGPLCGLVAVTDPQIPGAMTGVLYGGPVAMTDGTDPLTTYQGRLVCTIQIGTDETHAEHLGNQGRLVGNTGLASGVAGTVTYEHGESGDVWVCSRVELTTGATLYWDAVNERWSTSSTTTCGFATTVHTGNAVSALRVLDPVVCPVFALVFPPQGDIPGVWDCPPYVVQHLGPLGDTEVHVLTPPVAD